MNYSTKRSAWSEAELKSYASTIGDKLLHPDLDPRRISVRESLASATSPFPTPIIFGLDVTGSMNSVLNGLAAKGLPDLMAGLFALETITDPQVMLAAYGDFPNRDRSPAQFGQFEINALALSVIEKIHFEGGGGGNDFESTSAIWAFALHKTRCQAFEEAKPRKGFIFTFGNDGLDQLRDEDMLYLTGNPQIKAVPTKELYNRVSQNWHVFHINLGNPGSWLRESFERVMGDHFLVLEDVKALTNLIVSTIDVVQGTDKATAAARWSGSTGLAVTASLKDFSVATRSGTAVVEL